MSLYFDILPEELNIELIWKLNDTPDLYNLIYILKPNEQRVYRMICLKLSDFFQDVPENVEVGSRFILWRSVYEDLINIPRERAGTGFSEYYDLVSMSEVMRDITGLTLIIGEIMFIIIYKLDKIISLNPKILNMTTFKMMIVFTREFSDKKAWAIFDNQKRSNLEELREALTIRDDVQYGKFISCKNIIKRIYDFKRDYIMSIIETLTHDVDIGFYNDADGFIVCPEDNIGTPLLCTTIISSNGGKRFLTDDERTIAASKGYNVCY